MSRDVQLLLVYLIAFELLRLVPSYVWRYVQFAEGAEPYWSDAVKKWENILEAKNLALTESSIYAPYLSVEVQACKSPPFGPPLNSNTLSQ